MEVYWIVWVISVLLAAFCKIFDYPLSKELTIKRVRHRSNAKVAFVFAAILLIIIAGCRYDVGADFWNYYSYVNYLDLQESISKFNEPGIRLVYSIAVRIHDSRGMCITAVAAVTIGLQLKTLFKNTDNIGFALALFTFMCWSACFNAVRQVLAVAVLFCGLPALRSKNFMRYAFFVFLAFLCHKSAIVMILMYFVVHREVNKINVITLAILTFIVLFSYDQVFGLVNVVLNENLTGNELYWSTQVNILRVFANISPAVLFLYLYKDVKKTREVNFYLNLLLLHGIVSVSTSGSASVARMVLYTAPFAVLAMAELIKLLPARNRQIYSIIIIVLFWAMEWYQCSSSGSLNNYQLRWFW